MSAKNQQTSGVKPVEFECEAPVAKTVILVGDFNMWNPFATPMKKGRSGIWTAEMTLAPGPTRVQVRGRWLLVLRPGRTGRPPLQNQSRTEHLRNDESFDRCRVGTAGIFTLQVNMETRQMSEGPSISPCSDHRFLGLNGPICFRLGDAIFLMIVGAESGVIMQWIHQLEWNFFVLSLLGMAAAMSVQMLLALGLSPLLGSIETMAPSMVVAMVVPMLIDIAEILDMMIGRFEAGLLGAAIGLVFIAYLEWYGAAVRRRLAQARPERAGAS